MSEATFPKLDERIVGETATTIEQHPFQVSLRLRNIPLCGGSIISQTVVLTAAHCTNTFSSGDISIRYGSSSKSSGGTIDAVQSICQHPQYNSVTTNNDVSVLFVANGFTFSPTVQAIALPMVNEEVPTGSLATVTGWGTLYYLGPSPDILQEVDVPKVSETACKRAYFFKVITDSMVCFGYTTDRKGMCQGDSGGPIVYNQKQVGITSFSSGCAQPGFPGVYADTAAESIANHISGCVVQFKN